jgi:hypothetical protein
MIERNISFALYLVQSLILSYSNQHLHNFLVFLIYRMYVKDPGVHYGLTVKHNVKTALKFQCKERVLIPSSQCCSLLVLGGYTTAIGVKLLNW